MYPAIVTVAFEAFSCYTFDVGTALQSRYLIADVAVSCDAEDQWAPVRASAWVAILMYAPDRGSHSARRLLCFHMPCAHRALGMVCAAGTRSAFRSCMASF